MRQQCDLCGGSSPQRWMPRLPYEFLFVMGGWDGNRDLDAVWAYDPSAKRWLDHRNEGFAPRSDHAVVVLGKRLYVIGGQREQSYLRSLDCFDMERCVWEQRSPMRMTRAFACVSTLKAQLHVMRGATVTIL